MQSQKKKLDKIFEEPLNGYSKIHILNGYTFPTDKDTFYKYMPLERFLSNVYHKQFVFVSPEVWKDPFERLYFNVDCSSHSYKTEAIACLCVTDKSSTNEDASWKAYTDQGEKAVRLSIHREKFLKMMDEFADKNKYEVYIGKAQYGYEKQEIMDLYKPSSPYHDLFFPDPMERMHYLTVMTLKRSAFEYENEFRVFLVKDEIKYENRIVPVPCDYKGLITGVELCPYPPLPDQNDLVHSTYKKFQEAESQELKRILKNLLGCRIRQSRLYDTEGKVKELKAPKPVI